MLERNKEGSGREGRLCCCRLACCAVNVTVVRSARAQQGARACRPAVPASSAAYQPLHCSLWHPCCWAALLQVGRVRTEEAILSAVDHPFLASLYGTLQTGARSEGQRGPTGFAGHCCCVIVCMCDVPMPAVSANAPGAHAPCQPPPASQHLQRSPILSTSCLPPTQTRTCTSCWSTATAASCMRCSTRSPSEGGAVRGLAGVAAGCRVITQHICCIGTRHAAAPPPQHPALGSHAPVLPLPCPLPQCSFPPLHWHGIQDRISYPHFAHATPQTRPVFNPLCAASD